MALAVISINSKSKMRGPRVFGGHLSCIARFLPFLFCLSGIPGTALATNGYFFYGYSASQDAMGGAGTAIAEDALVVALNPAGAVWVGDRLDVELSVFKPYRYYTATPRGPRAGNGIFMIGPSSQAWRSDNNTFYIPAFAFNHMIDRQSSWGISIYGNGGVNSKFSGNYAIFAQNLLGFEAHCDGAFGGGAPLAGTTDPQGLCGNSNPEIGLDLQQLFLVPSYSRKIGNWGSVGVSMILAEQRFKAFGLAAFSKYSNHPALLSDNDYSNSYGYGFRIGMLLHPFHWISIGGSYQFRIRMTKFKKYRGLFADNGNFDIPQTWNIGIQLHLTHVQQVVFDFQRIYYSEVHSVGNPFNPNDFVNNCVLPRLFGNTASLPACLGSANGPGFGLRDMSIYKIGYQLTLGALKLRAGFSFSRQPTPSSQVLFNTLASTSPEKHFTGGFSYALSPALSLACAFMYAPDHMISGRNPLSNTSANLLQVLASGILKSNMTANAFGSDSQDQTIKLNMRQYQVTVGLHYRF